MPGFLFLAHLFHFIEEFVSCFIKKMETTPVILLFLHPVLKNHSGCSAVGSALRSGRRGRAFESPHPDRRQVGLKARLTLRPSLFYIESCAIQEFRPHHDLMHVVIKRCKSINNKDYDKNHCGIRGVLSTLKSTVINFYYIANLLIVNG